MKRDPHPLKAVLKQLSPACLLALAMPAHAERVTLDLQGLNDAQSNAVRARLELAQYLDRDVTPAQVQRLFRLADDEITTALQPFGYYHPHIDSALEQPDANILHAVFRVDLGEPVRIANAAVQVQGPAQDDDTVRNALAQFHPTQGEQLDDAVYEQSKSRVDNALRARGYLRAELTTHRVAVTEGANSADVNVVWQSGPRFRLGETHYSGGQFSDRFLQRFVLWEQGAYYTEQQVLDFQQNLIDSGYFAAVSVRPDLDHAHDDVVPVQVVLVPAKRNAYTANVYVSTDSGPGAELAYQRRWMNDRGHKLQTTLDYAQRTKQEAITYSIPLPGANSRSYSFGIAHNEDDTTSSQSRTTHYVVSQSRRWQDFTRTLSLKYLTGNFEVANVQGRSNLLFLEGVLTRKRTDSSFFTHNGASLMITLRYGPQLSFSDTQFAQLRVDGKWIHSNSDRDRIILRASTGAMTVRDFDLLTPELRFFAGGDRSIRGFGYQQIGETNASGGVIGGKYLAVASSEYEHYFLPNWGGAVFVDGGDAFSSSFNANVGAGIGLRWKSPIGLVRLDVAQAVKSSLKKTWRIHFVIGPDL